MVHRQTDFRLSFLRPTVLVDVEGWIADLVKENSYGYCDGSYNSERFQKLIVGWKSIIKIRKSCRRI